MARSCRSSCRGARAALDVQHGEVIVVTLVAKGSPPGAGNPVAEPLCAENSSIVSAAVVFVFILLYVCTSSPVCWEVAFASLAVSKVLDLPGIAPGQPSSVEQAAEAMDKPLLHSRWPVGVRHEPSAQVETKLQQNM